MPTIYRLPKKNLRKNKASPRDLELWEKHCAQKGIDPSKTRPVRHPVVENPR